jgi:hypothetical protein
MLFDAEQAPFSNQRRLHAKLNVSWSTRTTTS